MSSAACKVCLPQYVVTNVATPDDLNVQKIALPDGSYYYIRPKEQLGTAVWGNKENPSTFNQYPIVMTGNGEPWDEANLFLFEMLGKVFRRNMRTISNIADDLAAYRNFLENEGLDWKDFPAHKFAKPTYRFSAHLQSLVWAKALQPSTANRRIGVMVRFYRWLKSEQLLIPAAPLWKEEVRYIRTKRTHGQESSVKVLTTDLRISAPVADDPFDGSLQDGGRLRPLEPEQQGWILDALEFCGNTEMTLIHLFALLTGARIQTILTFKVRNTLQAHTHGNFLTYAVGPGTGIDTKYDKKLVIHIPTWFYEKLTIYASSARARKRRQLAIGGDTDAQYLFLSVRGAPMYIAKQDLSYPRAHPARYHKCGQAVRQYAADYILPYIHEKYDKRFHYRFHDLRATFGINLVDQLQPLIQVGKISYTEILDLVRVRMGHESVETTEQYLKFRTRQKIFRRAQGEWESKLREITDRAMERANDDV